VVGGGSGSKLDALLGCGTPGTDALERHTRRVDHEDPLVREKVLGRGHKALEQGYAAPQVVPRGAVMKSWRPGLLRPSVWDILECQVKLWAPDGPRMDRKEFIREASEVKLLKEEIEEKGTTREKLSFALYELEKMFMRPDHPGRDIATDANRLVTGDDEFFCRRANRILVNVG
jgi:hypothetical protein